MIKTFKELQTVDEVVAKLYQENSALKDTKFGYAYKKFSEANYIPLLKEFQEAIGNARIDHALEDEKTKAILVDSESPRGYKFSKEGWKAIIQEESKIVNLFEIKDTEIKPYISSFVPELTEEQTEILKGLII